MNFIPVAISIISGVFATNFVGVLSRRLHLGSYGNLMAGILGGGLLGYAAVQLDLEPLAEWQIVQPDFPYFLLLSVGGAVFTQGVFSFVKRILFKRAVGKKRRRSQRR